MLYRWQVDGVVMYRSPVLDAVGVAHGFGTRQGDDRAMARLLGLNDRSWVTVRQVHGRAVHVEADEPDASAQLPRCDADAVVLNRPRSMTRILTADCLPILLASVDGRTVAAVHAGWRGLVAGVIESAAAALGGAFVAAIGPSISVDHFEVGDEVAERFDGRFVVRTLGHKPHVDLPAAAYAILTGLGARTIDTTDRCTYAHEADFFSHRRDVTHRRMPTTGRLASVIGAAWP